MSTLRDTFLTGYNRDTSAPYHVRYEAGLQAVADAAKAEVLNAGWVEFALLDDASGHVTYWGRANFLDGATDPKDYPGFTIVTRQAGEWQPFVPAVEGSET